MQGLVDFVKALGATRLAAMAAVTAALIGFFTLVILRVTSPQMTPLFTDLSVEDSAAIVKDLDRQAIAYEIRNEGSIVMVPKDRVTRLRMSGWSNTWSCVNCSQRPSRSNHARLSPTWAQV